MNVNANADDSHAVARDAVAVRGLVKWAGRSRVLDGVDLAVRSGEVHALLGLGGTGKSTLVATVLGSQHPDEGEIVVFGVPQQRWTPRLRERLAGSPGEGHFWPDLNGGQLIDMSAQPHGGIDPVRRRELLDLFGLDPTRSGYSYTPEERRHIALIAALASGAELLVLDEPMAALDVGAKRAFVEWLAAHRRGRTILFTTRNFADAEVIADRASILHDGRIVVSGSVPQVRGRGRTAITAELERPDLALLDLPSVHNLETCGNTIYCDVETAHLQQFLPRLATAGVRSLTSSPPTLRRLIDAWTVEPTGMPA